MSKQKVMAIVISAVVVIAGVGVAIPVLRNRNAASQVEEPTTVISEETTAAVEETTAAEETETEIESFTNEAGKLVTKVKTVAKKAKDTAETEADNTKKTATSYEDTGVWYVDAVHRGLSSMEQEAVLGYSYNSEGDYFYTDDKDCWQAGFGYNEIYDQCAPLGCMWIDDMRIRFDYGPEAWMIQLWKGQYGWIFVGAEIGVYTTTNFHTGDVDANSINQYACAAEPDWLNMKMEVLWDDDQDGKYTSIFTRPYTKYWWCTGFKFGTLNKFSSPIRELIMNARITFKSSEMASLFTRGMKMEGFSSAGSASGLGNDTIYQSGADVYFRWQQVYKRTYADVTKAASNDGGNSDAGSSEETSTSIGIKKEF